MAEPTLDVTTPSTLQALRAVLPTDADLPLDSLVAAAAKAIRYSAHGQAREILSAVVALDPEHASAWSMLGIALEQGGALDAAERAYERALALDGDDYVTAYALAEIRFRRGDSARARALAQWIVSTIEDGPSLFAKARQLTARIDAEAHDGAD